MILNLSLAAVLSIGFGLFVGLILYNRRGGQATQTSAAFSVFTSLFWMTAGIFAILGGFVVVGVIVVALFFYMALGNYEQATQGRGIRARING